MQIKWKIYIWNHYKIYYFNMKIIYYSSHPNLRSYSPSGYGTHMREMIAAFEESGHTVVPVIMGDRSTSNVEDAVGGRISVRNVLRTIAPAYIWESLRDYNLIRQDTSFAGYLEKKAKEIQPDLIYERANYLQVSGVRTAERYGIPHVLEVNSPYVEERKLLAAKTVYEKNALQAEREQLVKTGIVAVVSTALKNYFVDKHGIDPEKIVVTPNAINERKVATDPDKVEKLRDQYELRNKRVVGFVGTLSKWHGVETLIRAFGNIRQSFDDVRLLIVGDGSKRSELEKLAHTIGVAGDTVFTGYVPHGEIYNHIELFDIAVDPNAHWYMSPVKLFEYGAMSKAVIAPQTEPVKEIIDHLNSGYIAEPGVDSLYAAIQILLDNKNLRKTLGENLKFKILNNHTWKHNVNCVLKALQNTYEKIY